MGTTFRPTVALLGTSRLRLPAPASLLHVTPPALLYTFKAELAEWLNLNTDTA